MLKITDVLPELIASMKAQEKEYQLLNMVDIIVATVCKVLQLDEFYIKTTKSSQAYSDARRIIFHIMRIQLKMNWVEIGEMFNRDHSTVIYSLKVYDELIDARDKKFIAKVQTVTKGLEGLCA